MVDSARIKTMRMRLGDAVSLIDDDRFLPMFRNRQINYEELFIFSIGIANKKDKPSRYFATIWSRSNLDKTVKWLREMINRIKNKASRLFWEKKKLKYDKKVESESKKNNKNIKILRKMMVSSGLKS